jgi:hypothetical protein
VAHHVLASPQRRRWMLDVIASPNLRIVFDPDNQLSAGNGQAQDRVMAESFCVVPIRRHRWR